MPTLNVRDIVDSLRHSEPADTGVISVKHNEKFRRLQTAIVAIEVSACAAHRSVFRNLQRQIVLFGGTYEAVSSCGEDDALTYRELKAMVSRFNTYRTIVAARSRFASLGNSRSKAVTDFYRSVDAFTVNEDKLIATLRRQDDSPAGAIASTRLPTAYWEAPLGCYMKELLPPDASEPDSLKRLPIAPFHALMAQVQQCLLNHSHAVDLLAVAKVLP